MKRSRQELSIDMVLHWGISENNQITLFPCVTIIYLKQGLGFPVIVICVDASGEYIENYIKTNIEFRIHF